MPSKEMRHISYLVPDEFPLVYKLAVIFQLQHLPIVCTECVTTGKGSAYRMEATERMYCFSIAFSIILLFLLYRGTKGRRQYILFLLSRSIVNMSAELSKWKRRQ